MRDDLQRLARELGVAERIRFAGFLSQAQLREEFFQSHIFLHPSELGRDGNQEGVPNAMLEAMASGLPVFATNHGGIPEAIDERSERCSGRRARSRRPGGSAARLDENARKRCLASRSGAGRSPQNLNKARRLACWRICISKRLIAPSERASGGAAEFAKNCATIWATDFRKMRDAGTLVPLAASCDGSHDCRNKIPNRGAIAPPIP